MKILLLFLSLFLFSCKHEINIQIPESDQLETFSWCGANTIDCYGDSFTLGDGTIPYPTQLAMATGENVNNYGVGGLMSYEVKDLFFKTQNHNNPTIIWVGKNNGWKTDTIMHDIDTIINALPHDMYFVITTWGSDVETDWKGDITQVWHGMLNWTYTERSRMLVEKYGRRCIDLLPLLQANADGSYADSMAIVHNVCPPSLALDAVHMNTKANTILVNEIVSRLTPCNSIKP